MTTPISRAAVLEILRTPAASDTFPDMIRRVEALEGCGVRVKALEWEPWQYGNSISKATPIGVYCVWEGYYRKPGQQGGTPAQDPKAAAQTHFDASILAALEPVAQPETPTPGQFTTMCLAIEDVVTGRGFDVAIPEEVKAYMRNVLMVGGWRGERD